MLLAARVEDLEELLPLPLITPTPTPNAVHPARLRAAAPPRLAGYSRGDIEEIQGRYMRYRGDIAAGSRSAKAGAGLLTLALALTLTLTLTLALTCCRSQAPASSRMRRRRSASSLDSSVWLG